MRYEEKTFVALDVHEAMFAQRRELVAQGNAAATLVEERDLGCGERVRIHFGRPHELAFGGPPKRSKRGVLPAMTYSGSMKSSVGAPSTALACAWKCRCGRGLLPEEPHCATASPALTL
jgi:hypothetical protein